MIMVIMVMVVKSWNVVLVLSFKFLRWHCGDYGVGYGDYGDGCD